jgi:hypothetical protein
VRLLRREIDERNKATFKMLLQELQKARDEGVTFEENDVHDLSRWCCVCLTRFLKELPGAICD